MILDMPVQDFLCGAPANFPSGARRHRTRINAIEIASRGEHIDASARWSAAWSGLTKRPSSAARSDAFSASRSNR